MVNVCLPACLPFNLYFYSFCELLIFSFCFLSVYSPRAFQHFCGKVLIFWSINFKYLDFVVLMVCARSEKPGRLLIENVGVMFSQVDNDTPTFNSQIMILRLNFQVTNASRWGHRTNHQNRIVYPRRLLIFSYSILIPH